MFYKGKIEIKYYFLKWKNMLKEKKKIEIRYFKKYIF